MNEEEAQSAAFAKHFQQKGYDAVIPKPGSTILL